MLRICLCVLISMFLIFGCEDVSNIKLPQPVGYSIMSLYRAIHDASLHVTVRELDMDMFPEGIEGARFVSSGSDRVTPPSADTPIVIFPIKTLN